MVGFLLIGVGLFGVGLAVGFFLIPWQGQLISGALLWRIYVMKSYYVIIFWGLSPIFSSLLGIVSEKNPEKVWSFAKPPSDPPLVNMKFQCDFLAIFDPF